MLPAKCHALCFVFVITVTCSAFGKIADPKPITQDNIRYQSHRHSVWATDLRTEKVLWKTDVPMDKYREPFDPDLEEDVQWNIISSLKLQGGILHLENSKGESFRLNSATGKLITKRQQSGAEAADINGEAGSEPLLESIKRSASEGDADAQCLLANLYAEGDGIAKDLAKAANLYRLAAEQGHDEAQVRLGACYRDGVGVLKSNTKAYVWFNISAENGGALNGRGRAGELVDEIRKTLSAKELEEAEAEMKGLQKEISAREKENYSRIIRQLNKAGWKVSMRKGDNGSHIVDAKKEGKTSTAQAPNWRVAFISVWRQCEQWPE